MNVWNYFFIIWLHFAPIVLYPNEECLRRKNIFDRALASLGQSSWMLKFNKIVAGHEEAVFDQTIQPSDELIQLSKQAQLDVGVPTHEVVPLIQKPLHRACSAIAPPNAIILNSDYLNENHFGFNRCTLYHEAVHIKYHDAASVYALRTAGLSLGAAYIVAKHLINPQKKMNGALIVASTLIITHLLLKTYNRYVERRADIEGYYATQCHVCVHKKAKSRQDLLKSSQEKIEALSSDLNNDQLSITQRKTIKSDLKRTRNFIKSIKFHYLSSTEIEQIASDLRNENRVCSYHKNGLEKLMGSFLDLIDTFKCY